MSLAFFLFGVAGLTVISAVWFKDECRYCGGKTYDWSTTKRYCHDCGKRQ